jgi:hypothetical protein
MIKLTVFDVMNSIGALNRIMTKELNATTAYKFARIARRLSDEIESFNKARESTFSRYAGGEEKVPDNKAKEFEAEIQELLDVEIELDINKIKPSDFGEAKIRPSDIYALDKFIEAE